MKHFLYPLIPLTFILLLVGCGSTALISTPIGNIDTMPLKIMDLTDAEKQSWAHADLTTDTIPGISLHKTYQEIIKNKKGKTVVVAVLDAGIDLQHEDLKEVIWTNTKEKPNNGIDDDGNGYVDDVHGYNFIGESYYEQLEYARIIRLQLGDANLQAKAQKKLDTKYTEALQGKQYYDQVLQTVTNAHKEISTALNSDTYTKEQLNAFNPITETLKNSKTILLQMFAYKPTIKELLQELEEGVNYFTEQVNYNLNPSFNGREVVGDNPYDFSNQVYGNGNPNNRKPEEDHGTHVAGIIAAKRNNKIGINGVANNVKIMAIRAVPNGDEYDKDIALGIRYAVDNGAQIINCSFGKDFSPKAQWVYDAIAYAAQKDVLIVHAAGNNGLNLDDAKNPNYPNDHQFTKQEITNNVIEVGALAPKYGANMVASFSNYGNTNVDIFAPGDEIYSTVPNNQYKFYGGTSMAAPAVAGIAALIRSHYPKLSASQIKNIIMQSGITTKAQVVVAGNPKNVKGFNQLSKSGKMANAYNALILANNIAKGQQMLDNKAK